MKVSNGHWVNSAQLVEDRKTDIPSYYLTIYLVSNYTFIVNLHASVENSPLKVVPKINDQLYF